MAKSEFNHGLNIAKKHTLRYFINLVGLYFGEPEESLKEYSEEVIFENTENLDAAIECFKEILPKGFQLEYETKRKMEEKNKIWSNKEEKYGILRK